MSANELKPVPTWNPGDFVFTNINNQTVPCRVGRVFRDMCEVFPIGGTDSRLVLNRDCEPAQESQRRDWSLQLRSWKRALLANQKPESRGQQ